MEELLEKLNAALWGAPSLLLILSVGIYLTIRLRFAQLTLFPKALRGFLSKFRPGKKRAAQSVSPYQALCTALAATVGTGNLVGVAGAICLGGPGAVFWMWICGILGMATKYAEAVLAVRYRVKTEEGFLGGPMYVMIHGLGSHWKPLAVAYCLFGVVAAFGVGNAAQINAAVSGINGVLVRFGGVQSRGQNLLFGILFAGFIGAVLLGGAGRIGRAAEALVPVAAAAYILLCVGVLVVKAEEIPGAFGRILEGAVSPRSVTGGVLGSAFQALQVGCSRGVFTNEAGMGTAAIAHASAEVDHPVQQGLMGIMEVFLDTILICTMTALVILVSGVPIPYGLDAGSALTTEAFAAVYGSGASVFLAVSLVLFAVATVLGWGLYGARCAEFLFGKKVWRFFAAAQIAVIILSAGMDTATVWQLAETVNGLMVIPNLITLAALGQEVVGLTESFRAKNNGIPHHRFD